MHSIACRQGIGSGWLDAPGHDLLRNAKGSPVRLTRLSTKSMSDTAFLPPRATRLMPHPIHSRARCNGLDKECKTLIKRAVSLQSPNSPKPYQLVKSTTIKNIPVPFCFRISKKQITRTSKNLVCTAYHTFFYKVKHESLKSWSYFSGLGTHSRYFSSVRYFRAVVHLWVWLGAAFVGLTCAFYCQRLSS